MIIDLSVVFQILSVRSNSHLVILVVETVSHHNYSTIVLLKLLYSLL